MKSLFSKFFEAFDTLSTDNDGTAFGISSPYIQPASDQVAAVIDDLEKRRKYINSGIVRMYNKYQFHITLMQTMDLSSFKQFSSRIISTLTNQSRPIFADTVITNKLADILTYCYSTVAPQEGFQIYSDINQAKKMSALTFNRAKSLGLDFLGPDGEDLIKLVLFKVFHKLDHDKQDKK